ncbi:acyltransferase family protein [Obesumbacterium proteus]|uniref:acyltransferase family protein n=1 Tax=Obesumbacterium proteus TaxID=82983 RepID=UPI0009082949|nr:acyltransferase [Obesumbacterium proteus]
MNIEIKPSLILGNGENHAVTNYKKLGYLDSLRGIASIIVVISHLTLLYFPYLHNVKNIPIPSENYIQSWFYNSPLGFCYSGSAAVYIFFIMSGIVLSISMSNRNLFKLISSRYIRLVIPACSACVLAYFCMTLMNGIGYGEIDNIYNNSFEIENASLLNSIYYGAIRSIFHIKGSMKYNPVLWTMAIEFYGSVLLYIAYKTKRPRIAMFVFSVLFLLVNVNTFIGIFCFFIGMNMTNLVKLEKSNKLSLLLLIIGLYFAGIHVNSYSYTLFLDILGKHTYTVLNALSGAFVVSSIIINKNMKSLLSKNAMQVLGKLSFPIYLVHWPIIYVISNILIENKTHNIPLSITIILISIIPVSIIFLKVDKLAIKTARKIKSI